MWALKNFMLTILLLEIKAVMAILEEAEYGDQLASLAKTLHETCSALVSIDEALVERVRHGDIPDDPALKLDEDGEVNAEFIMEVMPPKVKASLPKMLATCTRRVRAVSGIENKAYTFLKCVYEEDPEAFVFF